VAGFGNKDHDILSYKALSIDPNMVFWVNEDSSILVEGSGQKTDYDNLINNISQIFPSVEPK